MVGHVYTAKERAADVKAAVAAERERCARIAENFPLKILHIYDRPGGPPGNAYVPSTGKHIADAIRQSE